MSLTPALVLLLALSQPPAGAAQGGAAAAPKVDQKELAEKVKQLFQQLDDPSAEKREAAEKALVELGPEITPLLPRVTARTSAEVKDRLLRITRSLDRIAADEIIKPRLLNLDAEISFEKALEEIEKQTGNKVRDLRAEYGDAVDLTVKTKIESLPFWEGLDLLLDEFALSVEDVAGELNTIGVISRPQGQSPRSERAFYNGPFRFEAVEVEAVRSLRTPDMERLRLFVEASWEPRLRPVFFEQKLEDIVAKDDAGNIIPIDGADGDIEFDVEFDASLVELEIPLKLPPRDVKKISSLKGKTSIVLLGREVDFEFTNLDRAKQVKQTQAGVTVVLEKVSKFDDVYEFEVRVELDNAQGALESFRAGVFTSEAYLLSPNLERIENDGEEASREEENVFGRVYQFVLEGDISKYKFVFRTPVSVIRVPVEYELKDVELP